MLPERPIAVPDDLDERLVRARAAAAEVEGILALILFGSLARGTAHDWSDADIGVLISEPLGFERWAELLARLELALGRPVDLVDLARAPLPIRGRAVLEGRLISSADDEAWTHFVARTTIEWLDYRPAYERAVRIALQRLAERSP